VLIETELKWAHPDDPIFQLDPPNYQEHISHAYAQIGSPGVNLDMFWDVYNELREAVNDRPMSDNAVVKRHEYGSVHESGENQGLPLFDLQPCMFGVNGIPTLQFEGEHCYNVLSVAKLISNINAR
jgi:hypothetical protein